MRHVTTMKSPNNPTYVTNCQWPVSDIEHLRTEANVVNIAAHQAYLEKLQFEQNTLRSWSNTVQDQIMGKAAEVQMVWTMQQQENPHPWAQAWAERPVQPPPRPVQPTVQPPVVPVKSAPAARPQSQAASALSMSGAPVNAPFPAQMGADSWLQAREQNQK